MYKFNAAAKQLCTSDTVHHSEICSTLKDCIPRCVPGFLVAHHCFVYALNSQGASSLYELHLWYGVIEDSVAGDSRFMLCCFPKSSAEVKKKAWPPTASSSLQKDLKLKKLVSLAEFKGVRDKSTGSCWCFEQVVVAFLDHAHLLALLSISRVITLLGNVVNNTICLVCFNENVRHDTINNIHTYLLHLEVTMRQISWINLYFLIGS